MSGNPVSIPPHKQPLACPRCATAWRLKRGLCVRCLLSRGLDAYFSRSNALRVGIEMARPQFRQSSPRSSRCEYHVNKLLKNFSVSLLQPSAASSASVNNSTISLGQNQALNQQGSLIARMPRVFYHRGRCSPSFHLAHAFVAREPTEKTSRKKP